MTVKCAASSVGGEAAFTELGDNKIVRKLSLKVAEQNWAIYDPCGPVPNLRKVSIPNPNPYRKCEHP